jgi:excisionase family DNA binding protein
MYVQVKGIQMTEFMTVKAAAIELKKSEATVRRWLNNGTIDGIRMPGGTLLVRKIAVETAFQQPASA